MTQIHRVVAGWALLVMLCLPAAAATNLSDLELSGTLAVDGASTLTGATTVGGTLGVSGITTLSAALTLSDAFSGTRSLSSQTTENTAGAFSLTTDSTFLTGTDMTYSGARGSSALKLTGVYTGVNGGFSNIYSNITTSGAHTAAGAGVIGVKGVVTNSAIMTDGQIMGAQFIAKHSDSTADMGKMAALIGLEAWAYPASTGTVGTLLGANVGYHNECTTTQEVGSVHRGLQVFCDDASGAQNATESSGIVVWNMAGLQDNGLKFVPSGSGFTYDILLQNDEYITNSSNGTVTIGADDVEVTAKFKYPVISTVSETTASRVISTADYGKMIMCTYAGSVAITLPANGAAIGSWVDVANFNSNTTDFTVSAASADTLIGFNDLDLDSVNFGSGHRIGSWVRFVSNGTYWAVTNMSPSNTITLTD